MNGGNKKRYKGSVQLRGFTPDYRTFWSILRYSLWNIPLKTQFCPKIRKFGREKMLAAPGLGRFAA